MKRAITAIGMLAAGLCCAGCEDKPGEGPAEQVGRAVDEAARDAAEAGREVGREVGEGLQEAGSRLEESARRNAPTTRPE